MNQVSPPFLSSVPVFSSFSFLFAGYQAPGSCLPNHQASTSGLSSHQAPASPLLNDQGPASPLPNDQGPASPLPNHQGPASSLANHQVSTHPQPANPQVLSAIQQSTLSKWKPSNSEFTPKIWPFNPPGGAGLVRQIADFSARTFYHALFPLSLLKLILDETNSYGRQKATRSNPWEDITLDELGIFMTLFFLMGNSVKHAIKDYWSTDLIGHPAFFPNAMSRDRFLRIKWNLHFASTSRRASEEDRLCKIRPIMEKIKSTFSGNYKPSENLCIDASLLLFKRKLSSKQYIPSKRARFGVKSFLLCDGASGYVLDFIIYTGQRTELINYPLGTSSKVVLTLMGPHLGHGHKLYVDKWYTSPELFHALHLTKTNACGSVRANRKNMPKTSKQLKKGEVDAAVSDVLLAERWMDEREVRMLTTMHASGVEIVKRKCGEEKKKPLSVVSYNKFMGAVDRADMIRSLTSCTRKGLKWYHKLFWHFLDLTVLNALILYKQASGKSISMKDFRVMLIKELLEFHKEGLYSSCNVPIQDNVRRLTERHFYEKIPATGKKKTPTKRCHVCSPAGKTEPGKSARRKETSWQCESCKFALCIAPCFKLFHTQKDYKKAYDEWIEKNRERIPMANESLT